MTKKEVAAYKMAAEEFLKGSSPGLYGIRADLQRGKLYGVVIGEMARFAYHMQKGGTKKPISEIIDSNSDLKKMFAVYVEEGYNAVGFDGFKKALAKEGFDDLKSAARLVHAIEALGYEFEDK